MNKRHNFIIKTQKDNKKLIFNRIKLYSHSNSLPHLMDMSLSQLTKNTSKSGQFLINNNTQTLIGFFSMKITQKA